MIKTITKLEQVVCVCEGSARGLGVMNCTIIHRIVEEAMIKRVQG